MQISFAFFSFYALATAFPSVPQSDMVMEIDERDPQCCVQYFCNDIVKCPTAGTGPEACCYACVNIGNCPPARLVKF